MRILTANGKVVEESWRVDGDTPAFLVKCPICGFDYVHGSHIRIEEGNDNYSTGTGVRGNVAVVSFWCECGSSFDIKYGFHKGQTFVWLKLKDSCQIDYQTYIQSDEWKIKANAAKQAAGWRCQVCNKHQNETVLDAHHRTYERLGHERPEDITVLCRACHELYELNRKARNGVTK